MTKKLLSLYLVFCIFSLPCVLNAQEVEQAVEQAKKDATADVNGCLWFGLGFVFSIFGFAASYYIVSSPSAERLLGKSPEYVEVYTIAYKAKFRSRQSGYAAGGCITSGMAFLMFIAAMENAMSQAPF